MIERERVIKLIRNAKEDDCCDFKKAFYIKEKYAEMIKDIVAFANNMKNEDKYIVFNIDDETHEVGTEEFGDLPDISTINEIVRSYVEPYIDIELGEFFYENSKIVYIKISQKNLDRPYVITKDKSQSGRCLIKPGDIFIRKGATNFRANRSDLDKIYDMRERRKVTIDTYEVQAKEFCINNVRKELFTLSFVFENCSKNNYLLDIVDVKISVRDHSFLVKGLYLINMDDMSSDKTVSLKETPFSINPNYTVKKAVSFEVSEGHLEKMKEKYGQLVECSISLKMKDVKGCEVESEYKACKMFLI